MDPNCFHLHPQTRPSTSSDARDSNFNFPSTQHDQPLTLLHADQLFSNGLLLPLQLLSPPHSLQPPPHSPPPPPSPRLSSTSNYKVPSSEFSTKNLLSTPSNRPRSQSEFIIHECRRWSNSKRILHKYLGFLRPLYRKVCGKRHLPPMVNCVESLQATPRTSITISSAADWYHSNILFESHFDNLIYEAVIHCKKSTGETTV